MAMYDLNEIDLRWCKQKTLMLGASKIGKTEFWNDPKTFYIKLEPGHNHIKHMGVECRTLKEFDETIKKLAVDISSKKAPIDTVVVDTGDRFVQCIDEDVVEWANNKYKADINSVGDVPEGAGWARRTIHLNTYLKALEDLGVHVVIIFHVANEERQDEAGNKYKCATINLGGKAGRAICGWADHIMHVRSVMVGDMLVRRVVMKGTKNIEAGTRIKDLKELKWESDRAKNFANFRKLFTEETKDGHCKGSIPAEQTS